MNWEKKAFLWSTGERVKKSGQTQVNEDMTCVAETVKNRLDGSKGTVRNTMVSLERQDGSPMSSKAGYKVLKAKC